MGSQLIQQILPTWGAFIGQRVLTADTASMDISNIPTGFKYLMVLITAKLEAGKAATTCLVRFNADNNVNHYSFLKMYGTAGSVFTTASVVAADLYAQNLNNARFATCQLQVSQLPNADFKSFVLYGGDESQAFITSGAWLNAAEINEVTVFTASGDKLLAGSQFQIYGVP